MRLSLFRISFALAMLGSGGSLQGCQGGETASSHMAVGTETNWLKACSRDRDCDSLTCECGICTQRCDGDHACSLSGALCSSADSAALGALCSSPAPGVGLCLPACNETCGAGQVCVGDACIPAGDGGAETSSSNLGHSTTQDPTGPSSAPSDSSRVSPGSTGSTPSNTSDVTSPTDPPANPNDASAPVTEATPSDAGNDCSLDSQGLQPIVLTTVATPSAATRSANLAATRCPVMAPTTATRDSNVSVVLARNAPAPLPRKPSSGKAVEIPAANG